MLDCSRRSLLARASERADSVIVLLPHCRSRVGGVFGAASSEDPPPPATFLDDLQSGVHKITPTLLLVGAAAGFAAALGGAAAKILVDRVRRRR